MIQLPSLRPETRYGIPSADQLLFNRQYIIGFSYLFRQPKFALELLQEETEQTERIERQESFRPDLRIPELFRAELKDYRNSGFDRGHIVASANRRSSELINSETFLLSNMSPQHKELNRKIWKDLEEEIRNLYNSRKYAEIYVISGPLFVINKPIQVIGIDKENPHSDKDIIIPVPHEFFKCILAETVKGAMKMWAFALPNEPSDETLQEAQRTTLYIEKWAGLSLWNRLKGSKYQRLKTRKEKLWF